MIIFYGNISYIFSSFIHVLSKLKNKKKQQQNNTKSSTADVTNMRVNFEIRL